MKSNLAVSLLVVVGLIINVGCQTAKPPNYPTGVIELKYYSDGPWGPSGDVRNGVGCCDSSGHKFDLYYPKNLGANGFRHAILTWGNGTFGKPSNVEYFLKHMASWGFVVVATEDSETGLGQTILDGVNFMIKANSDPKCIFYNKLDLNEIGAFGHSQGAGGAIHAFLNSAGTIKTVVPIELPAHVWCIFGPKCVDTKNLMAGSIFFIDGSDDSISPPTQPSGSTGLESIEAYYNATPASVEKLKGTIIGPGHNDIQGQPDCPKKKVPGCINGVYGYLGYTTAWFMDRLQGDVYAHGGFVSGTGEIFSETKNWEFVASNIR